MDLKQPESFRDRLGMIDETGRRIEIIPARAKGYWQNWRMLVHAVLVLIFLLLPWIRINGAPAMLLDIPGRHFSIFGFEFWAHDGPMIFFVLGIATVSLALVTALWGRVWCGWACPQTVFIDAVFRRIEEWTEGNYLERRALQKEPWTFSKMRKKTIKWILFLAVTWIITHSFLAYFVGSDRVLDMITHSPGDNWGIFLFIVALSGILLFDFVWFREQFCVIMCPYGRFQSVLYDKHTITVQYDEKRGEPRKGTPGVTAETQGDCVNCRRCVQVCPTGIDIRNGLQMECIACTACIDACDEIMDKVGKPRGLIRYMPSLPKEKLRLLRPRVLAYSAVLLLILSAAAWTLTHRPEMHVQVLRAIDIPYFEKQDSGRDYVVNSYRLHIKNQSRETKRVDLTFSDPQVVSRGWKMQVPQHILEFKSGDFRMVPFLIEIPKDEIPASGTLDLELLVSGEKRLLKFLGPKR